MASRLGALAPRVIVVAMVILFATATLTFAAAGRMNGLSQPIATPVAKPAVAVVPNVTGQAYVFAKGILEDGGFAWRLGRGSLGYAGYRVAQQSPKGGTRLVDTGSPTILLTLIPGGSYSKKNHTPDQGSPYAGTAVRLVNDVSAEVPPTRTAKPRVKPPAQTTPAHKPAKKPAKKPAVKHAAVQKPVSRAPAFALAGAPREPLDEMPLTNRARLLAKWVAANPTSTPSNIHRWFYQHEWIVTGARYGWSNGAEALRILIGVDHMVERNWGMGSQSEAEAQQALSFVKAHAS